MKCKLSIQEKLKDLRIEKGLSLQELAEQTGISRASLGNYETDDYKEITHKAIVSLANFYGVTSDYLLGLTENREQHRFPVDALGLDDETVEILKSGKLNARLICEMIKHPEFKNFLTDMEIYIDNLAGMQFKNLNKMIEQTRVRLQNKGISDEDHYMKTLATASISEDNYFNNLLGNDIVKIAKDLRDAHSKDAETGDATTPVDDILDSFEELKTADNATQAQMIMYSKLFKINFTKMDPYEFKTQKEKINQCQMLFRNLLHFLFQEKGAPIPAISKYRVRLFLVVYFKCIIDECTISSAPVHHPLEPYSKTPIHNAHKNQYDL